MQSFFNKTRDKLKKDKNAEKSKEASSSSSTGTLSEAGVEGVSNPSVANDQL